MDKGWIISHRIKGSVALAERSLSENRLVII